MPINKASVLSGGKYRTPQETGLSRVAAKKAYRQAELEPKDINLVEVHDATSFCEIYQLEMLGFCEMFFKIMSTAIRYITAYFTRIKVIESMQFE